MRADLADVFRTELETAATKAALPGAQSADLSGRLGALCERGRSGHPTLAVADEAFVRHLARAVIRGAASDGRLEELAIEDLYLACACVGGGSAALDSFHERCLGPIRAAIVGIARTPAEQDEILQQVRDVLLVGNADAPPKIATFAGQGALGRWVGIAAQRLALMMVRSDKTETRAREAAAAEALAETSHPELAFLKERYRTDFQSAFAEALAALPDRERMVMRLNLVNGMTVEAIGRMYGVSQSTASRWLAGARDTVLAEAQRRMRERLRVSPSELESIAALVISQVDLSMSRLLSPR